MFTRQHCINIIKSLFIFIGCEAFVKRVNGWIVIDVAHCTLYISINETKTCTKQLWIWCLWSWTDMNVTNMLNNPHSLSINPIHFSQHLFSPLHLSSMHSIFDYICRLASFRHTLSSKVQYICILSDMCPQLKLSNTIGVEAAFKINKLSFIPRHVFFTWIFFSWNVLFWIIILHWSY